MRRRLNKKALSPMIATILLVVFALIIGTATMTWSRSYVEESPEQNDLEEDYGASIVISIDKIDDPLKELQIKYITGRMTLEEYLLAQYGAIEEIERTRNSNP